MRRSFLVDRLPEHLAADPFLVRFVGLFQELADTSRDQLDGLGHVADPTVAPPELVRWLGTWLGVRDIDPTMPVARQRALVRTAGRVLTHRGTAVGLERLLGVLTATEVVVTDSGGIRLDGSERPGPPTVWVDVGATETVTADHLVAVVLREVPAGVAVQLRVGGQLVHPPDGEWTGPVSDSSSPAPAPRRPDGRARRRTRRRVPLEAAPETGGGGS